MAETENLRKQQNPPEEQLGEELAILIKDLKPLSEDVARKHLEALRWRNGVHCPHCRASSVTLLQGETTRCGVYNCRACRRPFSVTVKTALGRTHIPLSDWLLGTAIFCAKGESTTIRDLELALRIAHKSARQMLRTIREAAKHTEKVDESAY